MKDTRKEEGKHAEAIAASYLARQGVCILQKNFRCRYGEIDLIGQGEGYVLVIEVKMRGSYEQGYPSEAVGYHKQKRICRTFDFYRMRYHLDEGVSVRFDIVEVDWNGRCHWMKHAFEYME